MIDPNQRVVITGIGLTSPNGNNLKEFRQNLLNGVSGVQHFETRYMGKVLAGVCDFDELKYQKKKKIQISKKKQHVIKIKEIRLRPKIGDHDFETKVNNMGRKFIQEGFKLKVTIMFRGREMSRIDLGEDLLNRVADALEDIAEPEGKTDLEGRRISVYFTAL